MLPLLLLPLCTVVGTGMGAISVAVEDRRALQRRREAEFALLRQRQLATIHAQRAVAQRRKEEQHAFNQAVHALYAVERSYYDQADQIEEQFY